MDEFDLSPEYQLLLRGAEGWLTGRELEPLPKSAIGLLDWDRLLRISAWHQLDGILSDQLGRLVYRQLFPSEVETHMRNRALENRVRYAGFVEPALGVALELLNQHRIPVIVLKGAALNRIVYSDLRIRYVGDIDLLIEETNLARARQLLRDHGYRQRASVSGVSSSSLDYHYCPRLLSPDGSVEIELHRHLVRADSPGYFEIDTIWKRSRPTLLAGQTARTLDPLDLLMHLCLAFFNDRRRREKSYAAIRQLVDIAAAFRYYSTELKDPRALAEWNTSPSNGLIYCSLWATKHLVNCPISESSLRSLHPGNCHENDLKRFVEHKILDSRPWNLHALVDPQDTTAWNLTKALLGRIKPSPSFLRREFYPPNSWSHWLLYRQYYSDLADTAREFLQNPRSIIEELQTDLWMNRVQLRTI